MTKLQGFAHNYYTLSLTVFQQFHGINLFTTL